MEKVWNYNEAAKCAGISRRSLERAISLGEGPVIVRPSPRRVGIIEDDLMAWLASRRVPATGIASESEVRGRGRPRKTA